jgi:hypothetical protein
MDKKIAGLLGAAAALTTLGAAQASPAQPTEAAPAASYRDLLDPIPNAMPLLKADDERQAQARGEQLAQVEVRIGHHHHHHHWRRYYHHHHHYHHHHVYVR